MGNTFAARPLRSAYRTILGLMCTVVLVSSLSASPAEALRSFDNQAAPPPHSVDLKWKASVSRVVGYNVYRSEKEAGPYMKLTSAPVRTTNYTDRSIQSGHTYFYAVTALDSTGKESMHSNHAKAPIPSP